MITLRLDIDKPYGRASVPAKILSKVREDFVFPAIDAAGYLADLEWFLRDLNTRQIKATSYHRLCTVPNKKITQLLKQGEHRFGLHAENTRSLETLRSEVEWLRRRVPELKLHSFTKHGSGELKLGRRHYAPYEPAKYREWSRALDLPYLYGNGIAASAEAFATDRDFYPDMFWLEPGYQNEQFSSVDDALAVAERGHLVLIVHPENLRAIPVVRERFTHFVERARARGISFT